MNATHFLDLKNCDYSNILNDVSQMVVVWRGPGLGVSLLWDQHHELYANQEHQFHLQPTTNWIKIDFPPSLSNFVIFDTLWLQSVSM